MTMPTQSGKPAAGIEAVGDALKRAVEAAVDAASDLLAAVLPGGSTGTPSP